MNLVGVIVLTFFDFFEFLYVVLHDYSFLLGPHLRGPCKFPLSFTFMYFVFHFGEHIPFSSYFLANVVHFAKFGLFQRANLSYVVLAVPHVFYLHFLDLPLLLDLLHFPTLHFLLFFVPQVNDSLGLFAGPLDFA